MNSITVIIPIYSGTETEAFTKAVNSILNQSLSPEKVIIAVDGPINDTLYKRVQDYKNIPIVNVIESEKNIGLGAILKLVLKSVKTELIARMDSDDVSEQNRLEIQYKYFLENNLDILGSYITESSSSGKKYIRSVPLTKRDILKVSEFRSPFNHVSVLMRRTVLTELENYEDCLYAEDWYLWLRLLKRHPELRVANLPVPLVKVNTDDYVRLQGLRRYNYDKKYLKKFYTEGLIGLFPYTVNVISLFFVRIIMKKYVKWIYTRLLRTRIE